MLFVAGLGVGLWLSALNVEYRDVTYTIPFLNQFWLFISPVVYSAELVPAKWRAWYGLNPMAGIIEAFRWALCGGKLSLALVLVSSVVSIVLLASGIVWFRLRERRFIDALGTGSQ
jgi:lipopolysaccharide transport system permease protein